MSAVAYINDDGDIWVERGVAPWPEIYREAAAMAREIGGDRVKYIGLVLDARVSDTNEGVHIDPESCENDCCRTIEAHHFKSIEW